MRRKREDGRHGSDRANSQGEFEEAAATGCREWEEMQPLSSTEDSTVEKWTIGAQDIMQCMWS